MVDIFANSLVCISLFQCFVFSFNFTQYFPCGFPIICSLGGVWDMGVTLWNKCSLGPKGLTYLPLGTFSLPYRVAG